MIEVLKFAGWMIITCIGVSVFIVLLVFVIAAFLLLYESIFQEEPNSQKYCTHDDVFLIDIDAVEKAYKCGECGKIF